MTIEEQKSRIDKKYKAAKDIIKAIAELDKTDAAEVLADVGRGYGLLVSVEPTEAK